AAARRPGTEIASPGPPPDLAVAARSVGLCPGADARRGFCRRPVGDCGRRVAAGRDPGGRRLAGLALRRRDRARTARRAGGRARDMRILFVPSPRSGVSVLSSGLLSHVLGRFPAARLTIAAGPAAAPLFEAVPGLDRLIVLRKRRWALHWLALYAGAVRRRWDLVVDLRGSALAWLLWAGERRVTAKGDPGEHRVRQLARLFGLEPPPSPVIWTAPRHDRAAEALVPPGNPVLAIGPAANWRGKEWRAERFAELATRLTAPEAAVAAARVAVLAAAHERAQAMPLLAALPAARVIDLVGRTDLLTAAAVLRRCAL